MLSDAIFLDVPA
jgi:hypothetical protein